MNAVEIRNLSKSFRGLYALDGLNMTVPVGAIYGFIGENGSGKSTTEKLICGHLVADSGEIRLFGKDHTDAGVRSRVGALIENAGCFLNSSVWDNLMMQAINLGLSDRAGEIQRVLKIVRMEDNARIKFKSCSLGMKQRIGIAMALLGDPALLILDEPINGLDADGMRIMREILVDITQTYGCTVLISSHILGELEKIATHYGIIRQGKMIMSLGWASLYTFLNIIFRRYFGISVASSFFFGTGILIIGVAALVGNSPALNIFLYGSSVYACLSANFVTVLVCLVCSLAWAVNYNLLGSLILKKCDVY